MGSFSPKIVKKGHPEVVMTNLKKIRKSKVNI